MVKSSVILKLIIALSVVDPSVKTVVPVACVQVVKKHGSQRKIWWMKKSDS